MKTRLMVAGLVCAIAFGPAASFAHHPKTAQPSQYCDANPTPTSVTTHIDATDPSVCFAPTGGFKGAVWVDVKSRSVVVDGDANNASTNRCFDGYAGVRAGSATPHLVWSQGGNYDPQALPGDGGTNGNGAGHNNDPFGNDEAEEIASCFEVE